MKSFLKSFLKKTETNLVDLIKEYLKSEDKFSDICFVYIKDDQVFWKTSSSYGAYNKETPNLCRRLRNDVGQNVLQVYGLPTKDSLRTIYLLVSPTLFIDLGFKETINFIKDWSGYSCVGDKEVVKYKVLGKR